MRRVLTALAFGLLLHGGAEAADSAGNYTVYGQGGRTCAQWLADKAGDGDASGPHRQWLLGYISAYNAWVHDRADVAAATEAERLVAWVDRYCRAQRRSTVAQAAQALIYELLSRR